MRLKEQERRQGVRKVIKKEEKERKNNYNSELKVWKRKEVKN